MICRKRKTCALSLKIHTLQYDVKYGVTINEI